MGYINMIKINIYENNWHNVPLLEDKPIFEITEDQYNALLNGNLTVKNGKFVDNTEKKTAEQRIAELKQKLADTDYEAIKYAEGVMTEAEYAPYKADRQKWRAEINELEKIINI